MFERLSKSFTESFKQLGRRGVLTEADVTTAMREIRLALLDADVALPVAKAFVADVKSRIIGEQVIASVSPQQMVVKRVQDALTELLGSDTAELNLATKPPAVILMCGLQGSGKTTSSGKLAKYLHEKQHKKVMLASLDIYRPAAREQLETVAKQVGAESLPIIADEQPEAIAARALKSATLAGADVLILDTAGRLQIDDALMEELAGIKTLTNPIESLLVADALTGQEAVNIAKRFHEHIGITGIILTRLDGDGRGGAALSMRHVTGQPIKFAGMGEAMDALEPFHPQRIASRILDMGDVVSLVEKAAEVMQGAEAEKAARRMQQGVFDMNDLLQQMRQIHTMGGIGSVLNMMPGAGKIKQAMQGKEIDEHAMKQQEAIILSMTPQERAAPKILNASRKRRIANGSGTRVQDVNRLIKQQQQMATMMKQMKKMGMKGLMGQLGKLGLR
jgi:signal recognition particle subunit SRP54